MNFINQKASVISILGSKASKILQDISIVDVTKNNYGYIGFCNQKGRLIANGSYKKHEEGIYLRISFDVKEVVLNILNMYAPLYKLEIKDLGHPACSFSQKENYIFKVNNYYEFLSDESFDKIEQNQIQSYFIENEYFDIDKDNSIKHLPNYVMPKLINYEKGCFVGQEIIARLHYKAKIDAYVFKFVSDKKITTPQSINFLKSAYYKGKYFYLLFTKALKFKKDFLKS